MSVTKSFLKEGTIYSITQVLSMGIGILLIPIYTRYLSPADYGVLDMINTFLSMIAIISSLEITQGITRFVTKTDESEDQKFIVTTGFLYSSIASIVFGLLICVFSRDISKLLFKTEDYWQFFILAVLGFVPQKMFQFLVLVLRAKRQLRQLTIISLLSSILGIGINILFVVMLQWKLEGIFYATALSCVLMFLIAIWNIRHLIVFSFKTDKLKQLLVFSSPLVLSSLGLYVLNYTDRWIINKYLNIHSVGLFGVAFRIGNFMQLFLSAYTMAIVPIIYSSYQDPETPEKISKIFRYFMFFLLAVHLSIACFTKEILLIFTTSEYLEAATLIPFMTGTVIAASLGYFFPGLFLVNKTKQIALFNLLSGAVNLCISLVLIPAFGVKGAAAGTFVVTTLTSILIAVLANKHYKVNVKLSVVYKAIIFLIYPIAVCLINDFLDLGLIARLAIWFGSATVFIQLAWFDQNEWNNIKYFLKPSSIKNEIAKIINR